MVNRRFFLYSIATLAVLIAAISVLAHKSYAQGFDPSKIRSIPSYKDELSEDEFKRMSEMVTEVPFGDEFLQCYRNDCDRN